MSDRIVIYTKQGRALAQALVFLLLMPVNTGLVLLGVLAMGRGDWVIGLISLIIGSFATVFCFSQIATSMRAARPHAELITLTQKSFYDCRIMKHAVPWSKLDWEICPRSGRVFIRVAADYEAYMYRGVADRLMYAARNLMGRFGYAVSIGHTGMPKSVLAHEMLAYRRPTGNHSMRKPLQAE